MVTFPVDDVEPAAELLPTRPLSASFPGALAFGGDPARPVLEPDGVHPLLSAVARAFAEHRPLVLSPDAVWLTIAHGVAQHVRLHADELRPRLVGHRGRKTLAVSVPGAMPVDAASWAGIAERLGTLVEAEIGDAGLFECDFSTSTEVERVAGRVVLLDVYAPYFAFWLTCVCGIPSVTLTGTVQDWQRIRERVDRLTGFGLEQWCASLRPIAEQFARAAAGDVDVAFWRRIYNPVDAYGGDVITGWVARLYPYLEGDGAVDRPNPLLELPFGEPRGRTGDGAYRGPGIRSSAVPSALSRVNVTVNDQVTRQNRVVALHAGLAGVAQDPDGALRPVAGWHLAPGVVEIEDVLDRVVDEHETTPPVPVHTWALSSELVAVYRRIGAATLFGGAWRLLPADEHRQAYVKGLPRIRAVVDLADGRSIAAVLHDTETRWVVCRIEAPADPDDPAVLADDPADIPVYGTSLALLLQTALDSGGDIARLEIGPLVS